MSGSNHGHTPAAWTGVIMAFIGIITAGLSMVMDQPVGFWVGAAIGLLGAVVGGIMSAMGLGQQRGKVPARAADDAEPAAAKG